MGISSAESEDNNMGSARSSKRKRAAVWERCNSCTSNKSNKIDAGSSSGFKQQAMGILKRLLPGPPYDYTKCMIRDRPLLREQQCKEMIRSMGLEQFIFHTEIPKLKRKLCDEFIASFDSERGCGVVQESISIFVNAETVAKVTGLPLGHKAWNTEVHACSEDDVESLKKLIPSLKSTPRGCCLRDLVYGSRSKHFVAIAEMLLEKMFCKTRFVQYASSGLIVGMDKALKLDMEMQWAEFMAEMMRSGIKSTQSTKARFAHGEWLSGIIQDALLSSKLPSDEAAVSFSFDVPHEQKQLTDVFAENFSGDCSYSTMQVFEELAAFKTEFENMLREAQQESLELKKELQIREGERDALKLIESELSAALEEAQKKLTATKAELSASLEEAQKTLSATKAELSAALEEAQSATATEHEQLRRNHAEQLAKIKEEHSLEVAKLKQELSEQETDLINFMNDPLKAFGAYTFLKKTHRKLKEELMS